MERTKAMDQGVTVRRASINVFGSVNLDIVATAPRLPVAGETVAGAEVRRYPGGKGANQALAARRLGADVALVARIGRDDAAEEALRLLREDGVDLTHCEAIEGVGTGIALIVVAASGENQIVVAPGANLCLTAEASALPAADALLCQLEVPVEAVAAAVASFAGFVALNLAPAAPVPAALLERADLIVVNETEARQMSTSLSACNALLATTRGANGAVLTRRGNVVARARPPAVRALDTTGAGDVFTAALTLALVEGQAPEDALAFACIAGALATTRPGAQPSFPRRDEVQALQLAGGHARDPE